MASPTTGLRELYGTRALHRRLARDPGDMVDDSVSMPERPRGTPPNASTSAVGFRTFFHAELHAEPHADVPLP